MNIAKMQQMQKELDDYIIDNMKLDLTEEHLLSNMFLAVLEEIQETKKDLTNPEEWIDILHFVLSIGNRLGLELHFIEIETSNDIKSSFHNAINVIQQNIYDCLRFSRCFKHWSNKKPTLEDLIVIELYLSISVGLINKICKELNTDMYEEYLKKYEINKQRQREGY